MSYKQTVKRFDARNTDLPIFVCEAAVDMENLIQGLSNEDETIMYLSDILQKATQGKQPLAMFPENDLILGYAIPGRENFEEYWKGKSSREIITETRNIAGDLRDFKRLGKEEQEKLRDFCLRLSIETRRYQNEYSPRRRLAA